MEEERVEREAGPLTRGVGFRKSLITRVVLSALTVGLFTIVLVGITAFTRARSTLRDSTLERLETVALLNERQLAGWIGRQSAVVEFLADLPEVRTLTSEFTLGTPGSSGQAAAAAALIALVESHAPGFPDLKEVFVMTPVGGEVFASSDTARIGDYRLTDLFFTEGREGTFIQNVYPALLDGRPTMTVSAPIRWQGRLVGVLAAHLELGRVDQQLEQRAGLGDTGEAYLISAYNDFVSADRFGRVGAKRGAHSEGIDAALNGENGAGQYANYHDVPVLGAYRWVPERELAVVTEMARSEALAPLGDLLRTMLAIGLFSILLLAVGMFWMARRIASPVLAISKAATAVTRGNLGVTAPVTTEDEVGALATAFNEMTEQLQSVNADLNEQARRREAALAELATARDRALRADRAKGEFLAMMSHEIRTPMNGVLGMTEVLLSGELGTLEREQAETIRTSGKSLLIVIDDILDFSKIEAGKLEIEETPFDVRATVGDVIDLLEPRAQEKGLALQVNVSSNVPMRLVGDGGRIRQILLNLTGNALKFTAAGGVTLTVELVRDAEPTEDKTEAIRFAVQDTGIGISPEVQARLFQPFRQADSSMTRRFGGTGLGLAISKRLAELMGGSIHLTSQPNLGSRFWIELPLNVATAVDPEAAASVQHGLGKVGTGLSILIVEDNPINQKVAESLLARVGCEVSSASNGLEGVEAVQSGDFDLVFMDCRMPEMDGFEATRVIRSRERAMGGHTPIVAMTANAMTGDREACLAAGMDDYVSKPIELDEIRRVLSKWGAAQEKRQVRRSPVSV